MTGAPRRRQLVLIAVLLWAALLAGSFVPAVLVGLGGSSASRRGAPMDYLFALDNETVHVFVEKDGSVSINYSITFINYGTDFDYIDIGFPNAYYVLSTVKAYWSLNGAPFVQLTSIARSSVIPIGVEIYVPSPQRPGIGGNGTLLVWGSNPHMVYRDTGHTGYAGIEFSPTWFSASYCTTVSALNLHVHFPEGFNNGTLAYYHHNAFTRYYHTNTSLVYVWEWRNESAQQHTEGVSFPDGYVDNVYEPGTTTTTTTTPTWPWPTTTMTTTWPWITTTFDPWSAFAGMMIAGNFVVVLFGVFACLGVALMVARGASGEAGSVLRQRYLPPAVKVEALGLCRGLSVVEAAVLHEVPLERVFTMIVFGLLRKGVITLRPASGKPAFQPNPEAIATTASTGTLHYYERLFLRAILPDGSLDRFAIRTMLNTLIQTTVRKLEGFSRTDTKTYYQQMVAIAWKEMAAATTPADQMRALDEYAEWLLIDPEYEQRLAPYAVWYSPLWYHHFHSAAIPPPPLVGVPPTTGPYRPPITTGPGPTTGAGPTTGPGPTRPPITTTGPTTPPITTTGPPGGPPPITIVNFANTFVTATQNFANTVVTGFQILANQIAQLFRPPPSTVHTSSSHPDHYHPSHDSSSHAGGGGHACACACACVSCACACAGGGR